MKFNVDKCSHGDAFDVGSYPACVLSGVKQSGVAKVQAEVMSGFSNGFQTGDHHI